MKLRSHQLDSLVAMQQCDKGQIIVPTGGGKTMCMIEDAKYRFDMDSVSKTIVVVAPRILLANQLSADFLEHITNVDVMHVHSGETHHFSSTKTEVIENWYHNSIRNQLIFTTYHSLHRITESLDIEIDTIYFDEAHNSVQKNFIEAVEYCSIYAQRKYFFTATPKYTRSAENNRGMNNKKVFGNTLINVPAPELVKNGLILSPKLNVYDREEERNKENASDIDRDVVLDILDDIEEDTNAKVLVSAPNTRILWSMLAQTDIITELKSRDYDIMHITSKHGAYINRQKVRRDKFFDTLSQWGEDDDKKFILFHYSILSEGINVRGLTHSVLLRNLPVIEMAQTIGRVIRLHKYDYQDIQNNKISAGDTESYRKPHGIINVPVNSKSSKATRNRLEKLIQLIFEDGLPAHSFATK